MSIGLIQLYMCCVIYWYVIVLRSTPGLHNKIPNTFINYYYIIIITIDYISVKFITTCIVIN